jgi:hypothetical protein
MRFLFFDVDIYDLCINFSLFIMFYITESLVEFCFEFDIIEWDYLFF